MTNSKPPTIRKDAGSILPIEFSERQLQIMMVLLWGTKQSKVFFKHFGVSDGELDGIGLAIMKCMKDKNHLEQYR